MKANNTRHILILGGVRSGKSHAALTIARNMAGPGERVVYIATGTAGDDEMKERIETHKKERPPSWTTIESPVHCARALADAFSGKSGDPGDASPDVVILDCLTMLAANLLMAQDDTVETYLAQNIIHELDELTGLCREMGAGLIIVSNEVGMGVVPPSPMGRLYRDVLGKANKHAAEQADTVLLMVAGLAVDLKKVAVDLSDLGK